MSIEILSGLVEQRNRAAEALKALYDAAGEDGLSAEQVATESKISDEIKALAAREANILTTLRTAQAADEARAALRLPTPTSDDDQRQTEPTDRDRLDSLLRGEVRSVTIEARDDVPYVTNVATDGQETITGSLWPEILRLFEESSAILQYARVLTTINGNNITFPKVTSNSVASLIGETEAFPRDAAQTATVNVGAYKLGVVEQASSEILQDSSIDFMGFIGEQGVNALGRGITRYAINGTGVGEPTGLVTAPVGVTTASPTLLALDELISLQHTITPTKRANAVFVLGDSTMEAARKLKDSTGNYLWRPAVVAGQPDTLLGAPVLVDPEMAAQAAGTVFGAYGDLNGFLIRLASGLDVMMSEHVGFENDMVSWRFRTRFDSVLLDDTAVRTITAP